MNRLSVLNKIAGLNDQHCKACPDRPGLRISEMRQSAQYCIKECPIGLEMKVLGDQLIVISSSKRELKKLKEEQAMSKRGPVPKEAPSCGLTKQIYIEQIAAGETNASIERAWGMKANTLYDWIKRWSLKGIKQESAIELLEGKQPLLRSTSPAAQAIEEKAAGIINLNVQRDTDQIKLLAAQLQDRNFAFDRLLLDNKSLQQKLAEEQKIVTEVTEDRDQWKSCYESYKQSRESLEQELIETKDMFDNAYSCSVSANAVIGKHLQTIKELEAERKLLLETIEKSMTEVAPDENTMVITDISDNVNHPAHYTAGGIECIDAIEAALTGLTGGQAYSTGAAIKYLWRWNRKNGLEDLEKAAWYVNRLIGEAKAE